MTQNKAKAIRLIFKEVIFGWARLGSNQGPLTYQISALPLSYAPEYLNILPDLRRERESNPRMDVLQTTAFPLRHRVNY